MNGFTAARLVLQLRHWQLTMNELLKREPGRFRVPIHCALGHEAVAAATRLAMGPADRLLLTHRNMAFHLAHAGALEPVLLEYELSAAGLAGGRLGSMNLQNPGAGLIYTSSILGNNLPVACGVAMALKERGETAARVYVATGDGAIEEGAFWESLVLAASHSLNICFLVENNDHSLATRIAERRCAIDLGRLAAAVGADYELLTGNDPVQYAASLSKATCGPIVREAMVTTFCNHAGATPGWATDPRMIDAAAGLELEASPRDPVHVARRTLEEEEYQATNRFLTALAVSLTASHAAAAAPPPPAATEQKKDEEEKPACRLT